MCLKKHRPSLNVCIICCLVPAGCINGFVAATELRSVWENRTRPVLYNSPDREISMDCRAPGTLFRILLGAYITGTGDVGPSIEINYDIKCDLSTLQNTEYLNVYECVLASPVEVDVNDPFRIIQISFLHDGQTDTPLISTITSMLIVIVH